MLYPEVSPSAPVSRDDLAAILARQQMEFQRGPGALDPNGQVIGSLGGQGGSQGTPFVAGDYDPAAADPADPAMASPTFAEPDAVSVSPFGGTGRDTSEASQAQAGRDAAAMAAAAQTAGRDFASNTQGNAITGPLSGPGFGSGFGSTFGSSQTAQSAPAGYTTATNQAAKGDFGHVGQPGLPAGNFAQGWDIGIPGSVPSSVSDLFDQGKNAVAQGWGGVGNFDPGNASLVGDIMGQVSGSLADLGAMGGGRGGGAVAGSAPSGGSGVADPGNAGLVGDIMGQVSGSVADLGNMGGGFSGFGATGGYSGSADMSNTGGAQGFGGGAVGGFGGGGDTSGGGGDTSGGGGGMGGSDGSAGGDNSGGSSGVG